MIPKGKTGKFRRLGIPTVIDRVVQASLKLVLEPIFEADFRPCSYGFRPKRRAQDAIAEIHHSTSGRNSYLWVFEADIRACFDEISHTALMDRVRVRVKDKRVLALVKAFLKAGILTELGDREETLTGTPQGGILSPLLANIALSALDDHFDRQWRQEMGTPGQRARRKRRGEASWRLVRYCDDFVLLVAGERHHAEALREQVTAVLEPLGLRLAPEKTRVVHIDEGFTFLGFDIRRMRKRGTSKRSVYTKPSKKAIQSIKDKVNAATYRSTRHQDLDELITNLNQMLVGWANYFRHGVSKAVFDFVDYHAWDRLMRWTRAKYAGKTGLGKGQMRRRFCDRGWRFAHNGVVFRGASSVTVKRYRYRGSTIPTHGPRHRQPPTPADQRKDTGRARCSVMGTPGSAGGPRETGRWQHGPRPGAHLTARSAGTTCANSTRSAGRCWPGCSRRGRAADLTGPHTFDLDSTICPVYGPAKQGAAFGYTKFVAHPLLATLAETGQVLHTRLRGGNAGSARAAASFLAETVSRLRSAGASGPLTMRADSAFYSRQVLGACRRHDVRFGHRAARPPGWRDRGDPRAGVDADPVLAVHPGGVRRRRRRGALPLPRRPPRHHRAADRAPGRPTPAASWPCSPPGTTTRRH